MLGKRCNEWEASNSSFKASNSSFIRRGWTRNSRYEVNFESGERTEWTTGSSACRRLADSPALRYGSAPLLTCLAWMLAVQVTPFFEETPLFFFLGAVIVSATCGGLGAAVLTTVLSTLLVSVLFVPPYFSVAFPGDPEHVLRMSLFVVVALMSASLASGCRRSRDLFRHSEERYRSLVESASDAILALDDQQRILWVNPAATRLFGYPAGKMVGRRLSWLIPDESCHARVAQLIGDADTRIPLEPVKVYGAHQSGKKVPLEIAFGTFAHNGHDAVTAVIRDLSTRESATPRQTLATLHCAAAQQNADSPQNAENPDSEVYARSAAS